MSARVNHTLIWGWKGVSPLCKPVWKLIQKKKKTMKETKKSCTLMTLLNCSWHGFKGSHINIQEQQLQPTFTTPLFIIAKLWNQQ
jgi:hypothetical protein